jgi:hypothetical protein
MTWLPDAAPARPNEDPPIKIYEPRYAKASDGAYIAYQVAGRVPSISPSRLHGSVTSRSRSSGRALLVSSKAWRPSDA